MGNELTTLQRSIGRDEEDFQRQLPLVLPLENEIQSIRQQILTIEISLVAVGNVIQDNILSWHDPMVTQSILEAERDCRAQNESESALVSSVLLLLCTKDTPITLAEVIGANESLAEFQADLSREAGFDVQVRINSIRIPLFDPFVNETPTFDEVSEALGSALKKVPQDFVVQVPWFPNVAIRGAAYLRVVCIRTTAQPSPSDPMAGIVFAKDPLEKRFVTRNVHQLSERVTLVRTQRLDMLKEKLRNKETMLNGLRAALSAIEERILEQKKNLTRMESATPEQQEEFRRHEERRRAGDFVETSRGLRRRLFGPEQTTPTTSLEEPQPEAAP